jgi:hypothetical protein
VQLAVDPHAEERDGGLEELVRIERVHVLRRHPTTRKHFVLLEQPADIVAPRIVRLDHESVHARLLPLDDGHWPTLRRRPQGGRFE